MNRKLPVVILSLFLGAVFQLFAATEEPLFMGKLVQDYKTLKSLTLVMDSLTETMNKMCLDLGKSNKLSIQEEELISYWFFGFLNVRRAFKGIAVNWEKLNLERKFSPIQREKILMISYAAFLEWYRASCYLLAKPARVHILAKKLNEMVPELGIRDHELTKVIGVLGDSRQRKDLETGFYELWEMFEKEKTTDRPVPKRMKESFEYVTKQAPDAWKIKSKTWLKNLGNAVYKKFYKIETVVSTWFGDTKYRKRKPSIHFDLVRQMTGLLKPGDILLERENWFFSNLFLPGFWKHGILYVGTVDDLKKLGLAQNPMVARHLREFSETDHLGFSKRVLEAVSDGVIMNSMEEATDADYICAFRPRLSKEQIKTVIVTAFSHVGKPYDFCFDFQTADKIVCTELIYRAFREMLQLNLKKIMGRWAYPADDLVRKFTVERGSPDRELDFVFFLDSDVKTQECKFKSENEFCETLKRPSADFLLSSD